MNVLIKRNSIIPLEVTKSYMTGKDNQEKMKIKVMQGENPIGNLNHLIGSFIMTGIPAGPKGSQRVEITYKIDVNGLFNVDAKCVGRTGTVSLQILNDVRTLTQDMILKMQQKLETTWTRNAQGRLKRQPK